MIQTTAGIVSGAGSVAHEQPTDPIETHPQVFAGGGVGREEPFALRQEARERKLIPPAAHADDVEVRWHGDDFEAAAVEKHHGARQVVGGGNQKDAPPAALAGEFAHGARFGCGVDDALGDHDCGVGHTPAASDLAQDLPFRGHSGGINELGTGEYEIACLACREKVDTFLKTIGGITPLERCNRRLGEAENTTEHDDGIRRDAAGVIHRRITAFQSPEKSVRDAGRAEGPQCRQGGREGPSSRSTQADQKEENDNAERRHENREELMEEQRTQVHFRNGRRCLALIRTCLRERCQGAVAQVHAWLPGMQSAPNHQAGMIEFGRKSDRQVKNSSEAQIRLTSQRTPVVETAEFSGRRECFPASNWRS
jgi:hypothetical protein